MKALADKCTWEANNAKGDVQTIFSMMVNDSVSTLAPLFDSPMLAVTDKTPCVAKLIEDSEGIFTDEAKAKLLCITQDKQMRKLYRRWTAWLAVQTAIEKTCSELHTSVKELLHESSTQLVLKMALTMKCNIAISGLFVDIPEGNTREKLMEITVVEIDKISCVELPPKLGMLVRQSLLTK